MSVGVYKICKRIITGSNSFAENIVGEIARLDAKKVFLICGPVMSKSETVRTAITSLEENGVTVHKYDAVQPEPEISAVEDAAAQARSFGADCILGIGGGSTLDTAKVCSILTTNNENIHDLFGVEKVAKPGMPLVLVPTSAGTGSETTDIAILTDPQSQLKIGIVSQHILPESVILDPVLTVTLPPAPTAASGIDALIHAMESYTSVNASDFSDLWAVEAIKMIMANIRSAWARGTNLEAREKMLNGSFYAGVAFCNAGVTAVHAFAYPIGARYHISHGWANALMLVPVFRYNIIGNLDRFARLAGLLGANTSSIEPRKAAEMGLDVLSTLLDDLKAPRHLKDFGVKKDDIPELAKSLMEVKRLLANNPREMTYEAAMKIYEEAL